MYIRTGILTMEKTRPQLPVEYAQQILVPEVGHRLIREDLLKNKHENSSDKINGDALKKQAIEIMKESTEYGQFVYPADEDSVDAQVADHDSLQEASVRVSTRSSM